MLLTNIAFAVESLVKLDYTSYNGTALPNGISQWLGVRFAAPPVGDLRFAAPQNPVQNSTVQQAKEVSKNRYTSNIC
jgi:carboxylesterase type B